MRGRFVVIEGPDLTGKSTLAEILVPALRERFAMRAHKTEEPWTVGDPQIRSRVFAAQTDLEKFFLLLGNRVPHVQWINRRLEEGEWVVSARYSPSTAVYQWNALGEHVSIAAGAQAMKMAEMTVDRDGAARRLVPDLCLVLVGNPLELVNRRSERPDDISRLSAERRFETLASLQEGYYDRVTLLGYPRGTFAYLDVSRRTPEEILDAALKICEGLLRKAA
jgi:thymidylate kinase